MTKELLRSWTRKDFDIEWFSGTGAGGQHRNKHQNCVRIREKETGLMAVGQNSRSRKANFREAFHALAQKLVAHHYPKGGRDRAPSDEVVRTYNEAENRVTDHASGEKWSWGTDVGDALEARKTALAEGMRGGQSGRFR